MKRLLILSIMIGCIGTVQTQTASAELSLDYWPNLGEVPFERDGLSQIKTTRLHLCATGNTQGSTRIDTPELLTDSPQEWALTTNDRFSSGSASLAPGDCLDLELSFSPSAIGDKRAIITFNCQCEISCPGPVMVTATAIDATTLEERVSRGLIKVGEFKPGNAGAGAINHLAVNGNHLWLSRSFGTQVFNITQSSQGFVQLYNIPSAQRNLVAVCDLGDLGIAEYDSDNISILSAEGELLSESRIGACSQDILTDLRLVDNCKSDDREVTTGRVEVRRHDTWGTVCDDRFDTKDAIVVCRQLGFERGAQFYSGTYCGQGNGAIFMDDVACDGSETALRQCRHTADHNCRHFEDVSVNCAPRESNDIVLGKNGLRLIAGACAQRSGEVRGRLEANINGQWGAVCDDLFHSEDLTVACRQLGLLPGSILTEEDCGAPNGCSNLRADNRCSGRGTLPTLVDNLGCLGTEDSIQDCVRSNSDCNAQHGEDIGIICRFNTAQATPTPTPTPTPATPPVKGCDYAANLHSRVMCPDSVRTIDNSISVAIDNTVLNNADVSLWTGLTNNALAVVNGTELSLYTLQGNVYRIAFIPLGSGSIVDLAAKPSANRLYALQQVNTISQLKRIDVNESGFEPPEVFEQYQLCTADRVVASASGFVFVANENKVTVFIELNDLGAEIPGIVSATLPTTAEITTAEITTAEITTAEITTAEITTAEITTAEITTAEMASHSELSEPAVNHNSAHSITAGSVGVLSALMSLLYSH